MSHQTGIRANEDLKTFFGNCHVGSIRTFKISIENEELCLSAFSEAKDNWEQDYDRCVLRFIKPMQPAYILYRLDTKNESGYNDWLLINWCPEDSPIRQKMLYASTKATLKQEFGSGQIKEEIYGTVQEDVSLIGLKRQRQSCTSPAPLSSCEEELASLSQDLTDISIDTRTQTLGGVSFPIMPSARNAIIDFLNKKVNYVQLKIDIKNEEILLSMSKNVTVGQLPTIVPSDEARYHLFNFNHTHEGDKMEAVVFIYSMPGYTCSIKERMLYSSCKATLLNNIENSMGLKIEKKLEIDSGSELTEEFLQDEIHPKINLHRPKFEKPKGPPGRGAKRLTKAQN
uniref:Twinfilin n=1 Tax=Clastoptera arizonana TaxID=38151 RepID=A0A1B6CRZ5_9HEMI